MQRTGGILNLYNEENFLQLSGIQHFSFCRRQWALAYIEMQWQENVRTVEGKILHENAHDAGLKEKRGSDYRKSNADSLPGIGSERRV